MSRGKMPVYAVLFLVLLALGGCSQTSEQPPSTTLSKDERKLACINLLRQMRLVCTDGLRELRSRGGSSRTNYDCLAARLEFQHLCI